MIYGYQENSHATNYIWHVSFCTTNENYFSNILAQPSKLLTIKAVWKYSETTLNCCVANAAITLELRHQSLWAELELGVSGLFQRGLSPLSMNAIKLRRNSSARMQKKYCLSLFAYSSKLRTLFFSERKRCSMLPEYALCNERYSVDIEHWNLPAKRKTIATHRFARQVSFDTYSAWNGNWAWRTIGAFRKRSPVCHEDAWRTTIPKYKSLRWQRMLYQNYPESSRHRRIILKQWGYPLSFCTPFFCFFVVV